MVESNGKRALWTRRKVQIVLIGIAAVLVLIGGGKYLEIPWEQIEKGIDAIELLVGLLLGAHAGTDIAAMLRGLLPARQSEIETPPAPPPEPDDDDAPPEPDDDDDDDEIEPIDDDDEGIELDRDRE
jgi:hypothetical protein